MISEIIFPDHEGHVKPHEYQTHYMFVKKYAELAGIEVKMTGRTGMVYCGRGTYFSMQIDGRQVIFDYSDHEPLGLYQLKAPCFKFHYNPRLHGKMTSVFPVGPMLDIIDISMYEKFFSLCDERLYTCSSDTVINCQRAWLGARERRKHVQQMLVNKYGEQVDTTFTPGQELFWNKHRNCLLAVCVPGARNNMIDRGHYEQTALGVCVIAPPVDTHLPFNKKLVAGEHFLECSPDYSNLIDIVEWARDNRDACRAIGENAYMLFRDHCRPKSYWSWIDQCLHKV